LWKEAGIKGISDILFQALGEQKEREEQKKSPLPLDDLFIPDAEHTRLYDHLYENYEHLKTDMESFWSGR
jgi:hypothetical protein